MGEPSTLHGVAYETPLVFTKNLQVYYTWVSNTRPTFEWDAFIHYATTTVFNILCEAKVLISE